MPTLTALQGASPLDADDTTYHTFNNDADESATYALDNVDTDFGTMDDLSWQVVAAIRDSIPASGGDTYTLNIRIINGATVLAADTDETSPQQVAQWTPGATGGSFSTYGSPTAFNYVNTSANKSTWDGASIEISQVHSQSKGADGNAIQVDFTEFTGNYTVAAAGSGSVKLSGTGGLAGAGGLAGMGGGLAG